MSEQQENMVQDQTVQNGKKKNPALRLILLVLELIVLVAGIVGSMLMIRSYNDPERVANNYFNALKEGDYATAYSYLQMEEGDAQSDFLNLDMYAAVMKNYGFAEEAADVQNRTDEQYGETFYVMEAGKAAHTIQVVETGEKRLFFFKEYEVCPQNFYAEDVFITAPKMMTVSVNGIPLNENNSTRDDTSTEVYVNAFETAYKIDKMLAGDYRIEVSGDIFQTYTQDVTVNAYYNLFMMDEPVVKEGVIDGIVEGMPEIVGSLYQSALNGEDVQTAFAAAGMQGADEEAQKAYVDLVGEFEIEDGYFTGMELSNFEAASYYGGWFNWENGEYCIDITVNYTTSYNYDELDWWTGSYYESNEEEYNGYVDFDVVYRNGEWVIDDMYISSGIYIW